MSIYLFIYSFIYLIHGTYYLLTFRLRRSTSCSWAAWRVAAGRCRTSGAAATAAPCGAAAFRRRRGRRAVAMRRWRGGGTC